MQKLKTLLIFFTLEDNEKILHLPKLKPGHFYIIYDTDIRTRSALFCVTYELLTLMETSIFLEYSNTQREIMSEIQSITNVITLTPKEFDRMWNIENQGEAGYEWGLWRIIRRLCKVAIQEFNWDSSDFKFNFNSLFETGKLTSTRVDKIKINSKYYRFIE